MCSVCTFRGRQAVQIGNDRLKATILTGGGHIASLQLIDDKKWSEDDDFGMIVVTGIIIQLIWNFG